jgi:hypothetical protein
MCGSDGRALLRDPASGFEHANPRLVIGQNGVRDRCLFIESIFFEISIVAMPRLPIQELSAGSGSSRQSL